MKQPLLCMGDGPDGAGCYRPYDRGPDLVVSDEHWRQIAPRPDGAGVLCVTCMHDRFVALGFADGSVPARFASGPFRDDSQRLPAILTPDLVEILGMPNFRAGPIAHALRDLGGETIPRRAEDEQAYVILWLLRLHLQHGPAWRRCAAARLDELRGDADG